MSSPDPSGNQGDNPEPTTDTTGYLDEADVSSLSDDDIQSLATERGYTVTGSDHEDIVASFLSEQELNYQFTSEELGELTVETITDIATARGYTITETLKADIITEFLVQQNASEP